MASDPVSGVKAAVGATPTPPNEATTFLLSVVPQVLDNNLAIGNFASVDEEQRAALIARLATGIDV